MAASPASPHPLFRPCAALLVLVALAAGAHARAQDRTAPPIDEFDAASIEYSIRDKSYTAIDIRLTRENVSVRAARATGADQNFREGTSTFSGDVVITNERGILRAARAIITFRDGRITDARIEGAEGAPATFEQKLEDGTLARGRANMLIYDVGAQTLRLSGDSWATDGRTDFRAQNIVYDIRRQLISAKKEEARDERVRITIKPSGEQKKDQ